ncbi:hypothetical protein V1293_005450 [Bradyrhizobium sp. AZCC 1693]
MGSRCVIQELRSDRHVVGKDGNASLKGMPLLPGAENPKKLRARGHKIIGSLLGGFRTI